MFVSILLITLNQIIQLYGLEYITAELAAVISSALTPIALLLFTVTAGAGAVPVRDSSARFSLALSVLCCCSVQALWPGRWMCGRSSGRRA